MDDNNNNNGIIPNAAVSKEAANIENKKDESLALNEEGEIGSGTYGNRIRDSKSKTELLHLCLYRLGLWLLFIVACLFAFLISFMLIRMGWAYTNFIIDDFSLLENFLSETWKVLTGAAVVVFVQLVGVAVKKKGDELDKAHERKDQ